MDLSNKWLKRLAIVLSVAVGLLLLTTVFLNFWLPRKVQSELDKRFHGTAKLEGKVHWEWSLSHARVEGIRFTNTKVDPRAEATGFVESVKVDIHNFKPTDITVKAKDLVVVVDPTAKSPPPKEGKKGHTPRLVVTAETLTVKTNEVEVRAQAFEHRDALPDGQVPRKTCVKKGQVLDLTKKLPLKDNRVNFQDVCLLPDNIISVWDVEGDLILPPIPGLDDRPVHFHGVDGDVHPKEKRISFSNFAIKGLVTFQESLSLVYRDGKIKVSAVRVEVEHPWVSSKKHKFEVFTLDASIDPKNPLKGSLNIGPGNGGTVVVSYDGDAKSISAKGECVDWEMMARGVVFEREGRFDIEVSVDPPKFDLEQSCVASCKYTNWPVPIKDNIFEYPVYLADGTTRVMRTTGPGTKDWVHLQELPPYVPEAVITIEDPSFATHGGILRGSLFQSLQDNLARGEFFRGGSTLTQQLAKNLFLYRDKTLERKMQEALLALALEDCYSKPELLELYLNVVEFGPDLYGIGPASQHYFDKSAAELLPDEAFYLARILPKPKSSPAPDEGGLARARQLMVNLAKQGRIPQSLAVFATDSVVKGWELME